MVEFLSSIPKAVGSVFSIDSPTEKGKLKIVCHHHPEWHTKKAVRQATANLSCLATSVFLLPSHYFPEPSVGITSRNYWAV